MSDVYIYDDRNLMYINESENEISILKVKDKYLLLCGSNALIQFKYYFFFIFVFFITE